MGELLLPARAGGLGIAAGLGQAVAEACEDLLAVAYRSAGSADGSSGSAAAAVRFWLMPAPSDCAPAVPASPSARPRASGRLRRIMRGSRLSSAGDRPSRRRRPRRHGPGAATDARIGAAHTQEGIAVEFAGQGYRQGGTVIAAHGQSLLALPQGSVWGRHAARRRHLTRCTHERNKAAVARAGHQLAHRRQQLGRRTFEQASTAQAEQRISAEKMFSSVKRDVAAGMPGHG